MSLTHLSAIMLRARKQWVLRHLRFFCFSAAAGRAPSPRSFHNQITLSFQPHLKPLVIASASYVYASPNGHSPSHLAPVARAHTLLSPSTTTSHSSYIDGHAPPATLPRVVPCCHEPSRARARGAALRCCAGGRHWQFGCARVRRRARGGGGGRRPCC